MKMYLNHESISKMRNKFFCYRRSMNPMQDTITCILDGKEKGDKLVAIKKMLLLEGEYRNFNRCWNSVPVKLDAVVLQKQHLRIEK